MAKEVETPRDRGYWMPAEWEPHEATWLAWPHMQFAKYLGKRLAGVEDIYVQMTAALEESELVNLLVVDTDMELYARRKLYNAGVGAKHVVFYAVPTLDVWTRDYGSLFVVDKEKSVAMTHWVFNGWGKFPDLI